MKHKSEQNDLFYIKIWKKKEKEKKNKEQVKLDKENYDDSKTKKKTN